MKESQSWQPFRNVWVGELFNSTVIHAPQFCWRDGHRAFFHWEEGDEGQTSLAPHSRNDCGFSHLSLNIFSAPGCVGGKGSYSGSIMTFHYVAALWISVCLTSAAHCLLNELIPTSLFCYLSPSRQLKLPVKRLLGFAYQTWVNVHLNSFQMYRKISEIKACLGLGLCYQNHIREISGF